MQELQAWLLRLRQANVSGVVCGCECGESCGGAAVVRGAVSLVVAVRGAAGGVGESWRSGHQGTGRGATGGTRAAARIGQTTTRGKTRGHSKDP